jgi:hypothetical protein
MIAAITRVKNGARWMEEHISSILKVCEQELVLDNHSTDETVEICHQFAPRVTVITNPHSDLNEARDKTYLALEARRLLTPSWCLFLDADEILLDHQTLLDNIYSQCAPAYQLRIWSCWDSPEQVRVDGIYGKCFRSSVFQLIATHGKWNQHSPSGPNFHCGSIPPDLHGRSKRCYPEVRVKHYGYMLREDRIRKYNWYRASDTQRIYLNAEDGYRHSVQGDLPEFPADAKYRHGGPLTLIPFPDQSLEANPENGGGRWVGQAYVRA